MTRRSLKDSAIEFLTLAASGKVSEAYERHVAAGFRHHNPHFRGDAASLKEAMLANAAQNPTRCSRSNVPCRTARRWPCFPMCG